MRIYSWICLLLLATLPARADLTSQQKLDDFRALAATYHKSYAPYEWKIEAVRFDLFELRPWLERIERTQNDLDYLDVLVRYVAALEDSHARFIIPSDFSASLGFRVDIYDGKVVLDQITRSQLPVSQFPFEVGDELVSVDGRRAEELIQQFFPYSVRANPGATRRLAADRITVRPQSAIPRAHELGETAEVAIRRRQTGALETYTIRWNKTGVPLLSLGRLPDLKASPRSAAMDSSPEWARLLAELQYVHTGGDTILNSGGLTPIFRLPAGFQQRLGRNTAEQFFSGVYAASGKRIGFIRIPAMSPFSTQAAPGVFTTDLGAGIRAFENEIRFLEQNTDGLIIDVMRNPGGFVSYVEELLRRVIARRFRTIGFEIRATWGFVRRFESSLESARRQNAPGWTIDLLEHLSGQVRRAFEENRGRTGPVPLTTLSLDLDPATDQNGNITAYTKPLIVLVDEFSGSGGDMFPAVIQDSGRGLIFGMRTSGAGGSVVDVSGGPYNEGTTRVTQTLMNRNNIIVTADLPAAPYVENIGVRPDIVTDYMTIDNLLSGGRDFVDAFTAAIVEHINAN